jgi:hypothetical protein
MKALGINVNGGCADYLPIGRRFLFKLPKARAPKDVPPTPTPNSRHASPPRRRPVISRPAKIQLRSAPAGSGIPTSKFWRRSARRKSSSSIAPNLANGNEVEMTATPTGTALIN